MLSEIIEKAFVEGKPDDVLSKLMKAIATTLEVDRCFLYVRHPETSLGKAAFCYCRHEKIPNVKGDRLEKEPPSLAKEDPMFAAALNCQPSIFVNDIETADPQVVNRDFERREFGHRALIHAHLCSEGKLWGVLQPSVFSQPRQWTKSEKDSIFAIVSRTTPFVIEYVAKEISSKEKKINDR